jgi:hypothetical protein
MARKETRCKKKARANKKAAMSDTFCEAVTDAYTRADTYGRGRVLASDCASKSRVNKFDDYCQTPSTSGDLVKACMQLVQEIDNDSDMVFNRFVQKQPDQWDPITVRSAGYVFDATLPTTLLCTRVRMSGDTLLAYMCTALNESELVRCVVDRPAFAALPTVGDLPIGANTYGFALDDAGVCYVANHNSGTVTVYKVLTETTASVLATVSGTAAGALGVTADGAFIFFEVYNAPNITIQRLEVATGTVTAGTSAAQTPDDNNRILVVRDPSTDNVFAWWYTERPGVFAFRWINNAMAETFTGTYPVAQRVSGTADTTAAVYSVDRDLGEAYLNWVNFNVSAVVQITVSPTFAIADVGVDGDGSTGFVISQDVQIVSLQINRFVSPPTVVGTEQLGYNPTISPSLPSVAASGQRALYYNQGFRVFEFGSYAILTQWQGAGLSASLCNNGSIVATSGAILTGTGSSDGTVTSEASLLRGECIPLNADAAVVTQNGLYAGSLSPVRVELSIANQAGLDLFCTAGNRVVPCLSSYGAYCTAQPEDPRCFCFNNPEGILSTLFNINSLKQNPALYEQLLAIAPCLSGTCSQYFTNSGLISTYLQSQQCPNSITICSTVLNLSEGGSINGSVVASQDCGATAGIGCQANTCPVGSDCDLADGICRVLCASDNDCPSGESCGLGTGLCRSNEEGSDLVWYIVAGVLGALVLGLVGFVVWLKVNGKI